MILLYYLLLLLTPFWNYPKLPRIGETFTVIKMVGVAVLLVAILKSILQGRGAGMFRWAETRLFMGLLLLAALSALSLGHGVINSMALQQYLSMAVFLYVTLVFVDSEQRLETSCYMLLMSMGLASYSILSGYWRYGATRPGGIMGDSNYFALAATMLLPLAILLYPGASFWKRLFLAGLIPLLTGATLLSGSRAGLICLLLAFVYGLRHSRRKVLYLTAGTLVLGAFFLRLPQTGLDRFRKSDTGTTFSTNARKALLNSGLRMIAEHPWFGVGVGMFKPLSVSFNPELSGGGIGHNTYLEIGAELGLPALAGFTCVLFFAWRRSRRAARHFSKLEDSPHASTARAFEAAVVIFAVGAVFLSAEYMKQFWGLVGLILALDRLKEERADEAEEEQEETESEHEFAASD